jgi:hypothetical protein
VAGWHRRDEVVTAQMIIWTSGFVLMSLVINAPLMTPLMTALRLNATSPIKQQVRRLGDDPGPARSRVFEPTAPHSRT